MKSVSDNITNVDRSTECDVRNFTFLAMVDKIDHVVYLRALVNLTIGVENFTNPLVDRLHDIEYDKCSI